MHIGLNLQKTEKKTIYFFYIIVIQTYLIDKQSIQILCLSIPYDKNMLLYNQLLQVGEALIFLLLVVLVKTPTENIDKNMKHMNSLLVLTYK